MEPIVTLVKDNWQWLLLALLAMAIARFVLRSFMKLLWFAAVLAVAWLFFHHVS